MENPEMENQENEILQENENQNVVLDSAGADVAVAEGENDFQEDVAVDEEIDETADVEDSEEDSDEDDGEISFADLGLEDFVLSAIEKKGFKTPSPIQVLAIPRLLNGDANIIAKARTGTGKTAAFGLPIVQRIHEESDHVRALVLEPTRELAMQTCAELQSFSSSKYPRVAVLYGGASYGDQIRSLKRGVEIVVGTPGRVQDHLERGTLKLDNIDYFILDEGDEMLDMGFVDDIENIFSKANPDARILLFSATMPKPILRIAEQFMGDYEICEEEGFVEEPLLIDQKYWFVRESDKIEALVRLVDMSPNFYGVVFTQTKNDADNVTKMLDERGYDAAALHGDVPQAQREKILARFRKRKTRVLVATDVAARGIDISGLTHVVNYSLPFDGATYVHRIGRTGRAGTSGIAVTFVRPEERRKLEFLKNTVKKAAKGEMVYEAVPSVKKVLEIKRTRLLDTLKVQLGLEKDPAEVGEIPSYIGDKKSGETIVSDVEFEPKLVEVDPVFAQMAATICENQNPVDVLAGVLSVTYGKTLDESHYGDVAEISNNRDRNGRGGRFGDRGGRGGFNSNQKRLYVQLGRKDGFNAKEIANYFSGLLHIPGRQVDGISVSESFSLISLPRDAADKVLEMSRRDSTIPHIHVDTKSFSERGGSRGGGRGFGGERGFGGRGGERRGFGGKGGFRGRSGDNARPRVHTPTERKGASSYKKPRPGNEF